MIQYQQDRYYNMTRNIILLSMARWDKYLLRVVNFTFNDVLLQCLSALVMMNIILVNLVITHLSVFWVLSTSPVAFFRATKLLLILFSRPFGFLFCVQKDEFGINLMHFGKVKLLLYRAYRFDSALLRIFEKGFLFKGIVTNLK